MAIIVPTIALPIGSNAPMRFLHENGAIDREGRCCEGIDPAGSRQPAATSVSLGCPGVANPHQLFAETNTRGTSWGRYGDTCPYQRSRADLCSATRYQNFQHVVRVRPQSNTGTCTYFMAQPLEYGENL